MAPKINKLNQGSMMPDLKYKKVKKVPKYTITQIRAKATSINDFPILKSTSKVAKPAIAFGNRAPISLTPQIFILKTCSQKNSGGFSVNRS